MGMLGGAAQGSFSALDGDLSSFNASYTSPSYDSVY